MARRSNMSNPTSQWYRIRWAVLQRDSFTCQYCGQRAPDVVLHVDHRTAVVDGGAGELDNLATACSACNQGKEGHRAYMGGHRRKSERWLAQSATNVVRARKLKALQEAGEVYLEDGVWQWVLRL